MIELKRSFTKAFEDIPLTWKPAKFYMAAGMTATLVCSNGHAGLIDEHTIADDGTVSPSVVCTQDNCTFHEFVKLIGWNED